MSEGNKGILQQTESEIVLTQYPVLLEVYTDMKNPGYP